MQEVLFFFDIIGQMLDVCWVSQGEDLGRGEGNRDGVKVSETGGWWGRD